MFKINECFTSRVYLYSTSVLRLSCAINRLTNSLIYLRPLSFTQSEDHQRGLFTRKVCFFKRYLRLVECEKYEASYITHESAKERQGRRILRRKRHK